MRIRIEDVEFSYDSAKVLKGVSMEVVSGDNVFIVGPNGAGKSTLLKVIARILEPTGGVVYIDGKDYRLYSPRELAKIVSYVDPHVSTSIPATVYEFLVTARYPHQKPFQVFESREDVRTIINVCRRFGIEHLLNRRLDQLSSGELQRIVIARAIIQNPRALLLDEPSAFLDIRYRLEILEYVRNFIKMEKKIAITAIHDLYLASLYADKVMMLSNGKIVAAGTPEEVFVENIIEKVYGVKVRITDIDGKPVVLPYRTG